MRTLATQLGKLPPFASFTAEENGNIVSEEATMTSEDVFGLPSDWPDGS